MEYQCLFFCLILCRHPTEVLDPEGQVPTVKPTVFEAEEERAFSLACAEQVLEPPPPPVSVADLMRTLKVKKKIVLCT